MPVLLLFALLTAALTAPYQTWAQPGQAPAARSNPPEPAGMPPRQSPLPAGRPAAQPSEQQLRTFASNFQANVLKGCLQKPPGVPDPQAYCNCYAAAFLRRYAPLDLLAINSFAARLPESVSLVTVMMAPERQACLAPRR